MVDAASAGRHRRPAVLRALGDRAAPAAMVLANERILEPEIPYFLYAASNAGSLLGLLGYLAMEPIATRRVRRRWCGRCGFWAAAALVAACAYASARGTQPCDRRPALDKAATTPVALSDARCGSRWRWCRRRCCSASRSTSPPISRRSPLLWVVPLALYLSTFIGGIFDPRCFGSARRWGAVAPAAVLVVLVLSLARGALPDPAGRAGPSRGVHGAGDVVPHPPRREPAGRRASHRVLHVRLARRRARRGGGGARRAGGVLVDSRVSAGDRRGTPASSAERRRRTARDIARRTPGVARRRGSAARRRATGPCRPSTSRAVSRIVTSSPLFAWLRSLTGDGETRRSAASGVARDPGGSAAADVAHGAAVRRGHRRAARRQPAPSGPAATCSTASARSSACTR